MGATTDERGPRTAAETGPYKWTFPSFFSWLSIRSVFTILLIVLLMTIVAIAEHGVTSPVIASENAGRLVGSQAMRTECIDNVLCQLTPASLCASLRRLLHRAHSRTKNAATGFG